MNASRARCQSARGLAHSKTWRTHLRSHASRSVLDCGSPLPLSPHELRVSATRNPVGIRRRRQTQKKVQNHGNGEAKNPKMNPDEKQFSTDSAG